jgi:tetratricopeptide (TPR) repeat protein
MPGNMTLQQQLESAISLHQAGRLAEAEKIYRRILIQQPNHPDALHLLGVVSHQTGQSDAAIDLIQRAIAINPGNAHYHNNLGNALRDKGLSTEAIAAYRNAVQRKPDYPEAHYNLGVALRARGQIDQAIAAYRNALSFNPEFADARNDLGSALREIGSLDEAIATLREAIRLKPDLHKAYNNLANALHETGQLDEAIVALRQAILIKPDIAELHNNLGNILRDRGLLDDAIAALGQSIRLKPEFAEAHYNLGLIYMLKGDFAQAWPEYEWRWRSKGFPSPRGEFVQPRWDGGDLNGRTILLHSEAGFGDTIQFVRYAPMVASRGGKVLLECQAPLLGLMRGLPGVEQLVTTNEPLPHFDVHCPMMNLPLAFGTTMQTIPATVPYLRADPSLIESWRVRLGRADGQLRIGLIWAGNQRFRLDRTRSLNLQQLSPLARVPGIKFFSLQKGPPADQAKTPPEGLQLINLGPDLMNFSDTAAVMSSMDLIISTDTSVAHLAGALARPVWVMLQLMPDWRWHLEREDSPWYPTMRLFRRKNWGDWPEVIERVALALDALRIQKRDNTL